MRIETGTRGSHQIGGNILPGQARVLFQKRFDVGFHTLGQGGVGGGVVIGAGAQAGKRGAVVVILLYLAVAVGILLIVGVVVIGRGTSPHEVIFGKLLAHIFGPYDSSVRSYQAPVGLVGED